MASTAQRLECLESIVNSLGHTVVRYDVVLQWVKDSVK